MKKLLFLSMVLLSVIFLAISAAATNYTVPYAAEAPAIDGVIDKVYKKCSRIDISTPAPGSVAEGHSTGTAYFAYDVNYLYLIVDVIDDTPCPPKGSNGDNMSSYDGILFAYNYTGETVEIGSSEGVGYSQFNLAKGATGAYQAIKINTDANGKQTGYTIEYAKTWPKDHPLYSVKTEKLSFAIWVYDFAYDSTSQKVTDYGFFMTQPGQEYAYANAVEYGLGGDSAWDGLDMEEVAPEALGAGNLKIDFNYNGTVVNSFFPIPAEGRFTTPDFPECEGTPVGWVSSDNKLYPAGMRLTASEANLSFELLTIDLKALPGVAASTKAGTSGLRFAATVSKADYDKMSEYTDVKTGALIVPLEDAEEATVITHQSLRGVRARFCDVINSGWNSNIGDGSVYGWYAAVKNIDTKRIASDFAFVPYVSYVDHEGTTQYVYAHTGKTECAGSLYETAFIAYEDRDASYKNKTDDGANSKYTKDELSVLRSYVDSTIIVAPMLDGSFAGKAPEAVGTPKILTFNYSATYSAGILTLVSNDGSSKVFDNASIVRMGENTYPLGEHSGQSVITLDIGYQFDAIRVNQAGYRPDSVKRALVTEGGNVFWLVDATNGQIAYVGTVEKGGYERNADEIVNYCDFTEFTTPGMYYLVVDLNYENLSYPFRIAEDVYAETNKLMLKAFYYNRCGCTVKDEAYSIYHSPCHTGNARVLEFTGNTITDSYGNLAQEVRETGEVVSGADLLGGWHDAGDYGRYTGWEGSAVSQLMIAYRINPAAYGDDTGIPESGNGLPDILDEIRYTLDWILKMQRADGAFYHKLTSLHHAGFDTMPANDTNPFFLWPVSVEGTGWGVASLAMAYNVFKDIDAEFANTCLEAAKRGYEWAVANFDMGGYPDRDSSGTGNPLSYNLNNELTNASCCLYTATGEQRYHDDLAKYSQSYTNISNVKVAAFDYILNENGRSQYIEILNRFAAAVAKEREAQQTKFDNTLYEFCYNVGWYANQGLGGTSAMLVLDELYNGTDNRRLIEENFNYILGKNGTGYSGILGIGYKQIMHPHLRMWMPGWITGGACPYNDLIPRFSEYLKTETRISPNDPPLKCYVDEFIYFQVNEPTIGSNAQTLIAVSYLCK